mmetsp:Transcript_48555/g.96665  ORF Transcript_48555/g.96665 Transcript_48555/m.96665 type:complete len:293 (+) Transcript_48555:307-1185(+)
MGSSSSAASTRASLSDAESGCCEAFVINPASALAACVQSSASGTFARATAISRKRICGNGPEHSVATRKINIIACLSLLPWQRRKADLRSASWVASAVAASLQALLAPQSCCASTHAWGSFGGKREAPLVRMNFNAAPHRALPGVASTKLCRLCVKPSGNWPGQASSTARTICMSCMLLQSWSTSRTPCDTGASPVIFPSCSEDVNIMRVHFALVWQAANALEHVHGASAVVGGNACDDSLGRSCPSSICAWSQSSAGSRGSRAAYVLPRTAVLSNTRVPPKVMSSRPGRLC